jgi:rod shape-determining protein MreD
VENLKIPIALIVAVLLQWTLRSVAEPLVFVDFPLIVVVYAALQRSGIKSLFYATISGLLIDALSGGLLGANAFSKTLIAYIVLELVRRVYLDNLLLRIPVIAGACLLNDLVYYGLHRLFGQAPAGDFSATIAYTVIGTTIAGTVVYLIFERLFAENRVRRGSSGGSGSGSIKRGVFAARRQTRRRNPIRLGR